MTLLFLAVLLVPGARADEAPKPPAFVVRTAGGADVRGPLGRLGKDWSVGLGGRQIAGGDVVSVRQAGRPLPPLPADDHLILANGDRIPFTAPRLAGERLHFRHPDLAGGNETGLPLAAVAVVWWAAPDRTVDREQFRRRLAAGKRTRDQVLLRNGDVLEGVLNRLDDKKVEVEAEKKVLSADTPQVAAVALSTDLAESLRPKGPYARLVLAAGGRSPGGRLSLATASCDDGATLTGTTVFGARLSVPLARVVALDVYQGKALYLSDLKASRYEFRPYLDGVWPLALDANVLGHDLRLGGSTFDKGLGVHSHARATYRLAGGYRRFEALVGLDDRDGTAGRARVRVLADGKPLKLAAGGELTAGGGPLAVSVPVEGVKELTLEVEFGQNGDVRGVVNWADARLVKR